MILWDDDERRVRPIHWGRTMAAFAAVLLFALLAVYLVSTADFGGASGTTAPRTPGPCAPFCPAPPGGP
ncbi:hypothetical protein AB0B25_05250 [Nocardia sp. NPDC049190]|uniref:hypothetical protein n=1 Tax=Nocardia sp. NPDC049190 TaxID=3155650 RepID=UPI0033D6C1FF